MKILKVIPLVYLPFSTEQELYYFADENNVQKFNAVILKMRKKDIIGLVIDIIDFAEVKIYLKKYYDYELKPIEGLIYPNKFFLDETRYKLLNLIEFVWLQPRSVIVKDFFPKFLFVNKKIKNKKKTLVKKTLNHFTINDSLFEIKKSLEKNLANNKKAICVFAQIGALEYFQSFFEKYFQGKFRICLRSNKAMFKEAVEPIFSRENNPTIFLTLRDILLYPVKDLGGIYVFDEGNPNYERKLEKPYFNIKKTAYLLSELAGCDYKEIPMFAPSFDFYIRNKKIAKSIINKIELTELEIVDTRRIFKNELNQNKFEYFDSFTIEEISKQIKKQGRIVILQNRKGYAVLLRCFECGYVFHCKNCAIPLKLHRDEKLLKCHYCNFKSQTPFRCEKCQSSYLQILGSGVEKIKDILAIKFRNLNPKFFEVDLDKIKSFQKKLKLINNINNSFGSITIGTTSLLDLRFRTFDLAVIPNLDLFFNFPGYNRTMETLYFVSFLYKLSRKLIVQSFGESLDFLRQAKENLLAIYKEEESFRRTFLWPPFIDLTKLSYGLTDKKKAFVRAILERDKIKYYLGKYPKRIQDNFQIFGPNEDIIFKRKRKYFYNIIIKTPKDLRQIKNEILKKVNPGFRIEVEV